MSTRLSAHKEWFGINMGRAFFVGDGGIKLKQKMELWRKNHDLINANRSK